MLCTNLQNSWVFEKTFRNIQTLYHGKRFLLRFPQFYHDAIFPGADTKAANDGMDIPGLRQLK